MKTEVTECQKRRLSDGISNEALWNIGNKLWWVAFWLFMIALKEWIK